MKKVRRIHFWIGVIVSIFLFIESITGIIMYFDKGEGGSPNFAIQGQQFPGGQASSSVNSNTTGQSSSQSNQGTQGSIPSMTDRPNFDGAKPDQSGFSVKSLHTGFIGLISGIGIFILTGTGIILSWILWENQRKSKKKSRKLANAI